MKITMSKCAIVAGMVKIGMELRANIHLAIMDVTGLTPITADCRNVIERRKERR